MIDYKLRSEIEKDIVHVEAWVRKMYTSKIVHLQGDFKEKDGRNTCENFMRLRVLDIIRSNPFVDGFSVEHEWILHNPAGPAYRMYDTKNRLVREDYYLDGACHRNNGPAKIIHHYKNDVLIETYKYYYIRGCIYHDREEFVQDLFRAKYITNEQFFELSLGIE